MAAPSQKVLACQCQNSGVVSDKCKPGLYGVRVNGDVVYPPIPDCPFDSSVLLRRDYALPPRGGRANDRHYNKGRKCSECHKPIRNETPSGLCQSCVMITRRRYTGGSYGVKYLGSHYTKGRKCDICYKPIMNENISGKCAICLPVSRRKKPQHA